MTIHQKNSIRPNSVEDCREGLLACKSLLDAKPKHVILDVRDINFAKQIRNMATNPTVGYAKVYHDLFENQNMHLLTDRRSSLLN